MGKKSDFFLVFNKKYFHHIGGDFDWYNPESHYTLLEKFMDFFDKNPQYNLKIQYSTPRRYVQAVYEEVLERSITFPEKLDDFFPYKDGPNSFWAGYYTSKPFLKRLVREASTYLQSVKKHLSTFYFQKRVNF